MESSHGSQYEVFEEKNTKGMKRFILTLNSRVEVFLVLLHMLEIKIKV